MPITQSGIDSYDYGSYLESLYAAGYQNTGTLDTTQADILAKYQAETLEKVAPAGYTPPAAGQETLYVEVPAATGGYTAAQLAGMDKIFGTPTGGQTVAAGTEAGITGTPVIAPLAIAGAVIGGRAIIIAIRAIAGRFLTLGTFKMLIAKFGPAVVKLAIGAAIFSQLMELLNIGAPDDTGLNVPRRHKRYTIGSNPRVRTLQRVAQHTRKLLKRHEKVIRAFLPKTAPRYGQVPAALLSAAEKKLIKG